MINSEKNYDYFGKRKEIREDLEAAENNLRIAEDRARDEGEENFRINMMQVQQAYDLKMSLKAELAQVQHDLEEWQSIVEEEDAIYERDLERFYAANPEHVPF